MLLSLTDEGRNAVDQILPALEAAADVLFAPVDPGALGELEQVLAAVRERAGEQLSVDRARGRGNHQNPGD